jgi:hypothetical protein
MSLLPSLASMPVNRGPLAKNGRKGGMMILSYPGKVPHLQRYNFFSLKSKMVGILKNFNPRMPYSSIDLNGKTPTEIPELCHESLYRLHCHISI